MPARKKTADAAAAAAEVTAAEKKPAEKKTVAKKAAEKPAEKKTAAARRGRPPLTPEVYVEQGGNQYNVSDIVERVKADYRAGHKVGVQSCKIYIKPEEGTAYYIVNKEQGKLEL